MPTKNTNNLINQMTKPLLIIFLLALASVFIYPTSGCADEKQVSSVPLDTIKPNMAYGFDLNNFEVYYDTIQPDWTLSHLFLPYNLSQAQINEAYLLAKDSAGLNYIDKGNLCLMLCKPTKDTVRDLQYAIYVKNRVDYYIFDFSDTMIKVTDMHKKIDTTIKQISAKIKQGGNLSNAISRAVNNNNISYPLIEEIAGIYAWSIDFFHLQAGDKLKVIYEEKSVEGESLGIGKIRSILFNHKEHDFYAFRYKVDSSESYYNEKGKGMKSMFLSAPLQYSRISSGFTMRRFHPVQKRWKSHLGTDYAAPHGTPIWTTADGVIVARSRTRGNGNYVKVKHNKTYSTQYLHMSSFVPGQKVGDFVAQGDIIGYVGSTGLATGPHVCYRFWKNGEQVDPRAQKFENAEPMDSTLLPNYYKFMDSVKLILDGIEYPVFNDSIKEPDTNFLDKIENAVEDIL